MKLPHVPVWLITIYVAILAFLVPLIYSTSPPIAIIVLIIALIVLGVLVYPKLRPTKTIFFRLISDTIVLSVQEGEEVKGEVQVLFKSEVVKGDIHLVFLKLWNASSNPILPDEYKSN